MANFWDTLADKTSDTSIGDTKGLIDKAGQDADADGANDSNDGWANSSSHDGVAGHTVADSSDHGASMNYSR
jgi:hypothetical protein